MKRVYIAGGLFAAGSLSQLISSIIFLFADFSARTESCIQVGLLLVTGIFMAILDGFLKQASKSEEMTDYMKVFALYGSRLSTLLLTVETLSVILLTLAYWFKVHFWIHASLVLAFIVSLMVCVLVVVLAVRSGKMTESSPSPKDEVQAAENTEV